MKYYLQNKSTQKAQQTDCTETNSNTNKNNAHKNEKLSRIILIQEKTQN